jgi:MoaA/NifB/PqqE/SkfB family radical SAM enzyme
MECAVVVTYRCNAQCQMCHTWQNPSKKSEEIGPGIISKIPSGLHRINLTGGEPALREDLIEIVETLVTKTPRLEISTNGYFTDRIVEIGRRFPQVTFRISIEGFPEINDRVRGIKNGFDRALKTTLQLLAVGVKDVGLGMVISDKNARDLLALYELCSHMGIEFATSTMHNSFYFHKHDNRIENLPFVEERMEEFVSSLLQSKRKNVKLKIKDWGRAFINLGLLRYMQGLERPLPCGAATDMFFLDPYGRILACNGSEEAWIMGNLCQDEFDTIWNSEQAATIRRNVEECDRNCWMVGTAVPAMRKNPWVPLFWIAQNKYRLARGQKVQLG